MTRAFILITAALGAFMPLLFDSAVKGAALLLGAAICVVALRRLSASARHLVWLAAVVALLLLPILSAALPQWRVLPFWSKRFIEPAPRLASSEAPVLPTIEAPTIEPRAELPAFVPSPIPKDIVEPAPTVAPARKPAPTQTPHDWLPLLWIAGFAVLGLRLGAAHLLLRRRTRGCEILNDSVAPAIARAYAEAATQLQLRQRVTILLDPNRTIPLVWGILRPHLLLPAEARQWSAEQLRSVLLHELAHIRRRDTLAQWLTQIACALHWYNPLVWLAAWRLHVERERACDDLVLASGVKASAYAEHLLKIATQLSPVRWTHACGLAMARQSSIEGRLLAVLRDRQNRQSVTRFIVGIVLLLGAVVAVPLAMLRAADEREKPRDGMEYKTDFGSLWVRNEKGQPAYIIFAPFQWNLRVSGYYVSNNPEWEESCEIKFADGTVLDLRAYNPSPKTLEKGGHSFDLKSGRVFLVNRDGSVRQLEIEAPLITDRAGAEALGKLIATLPPQTRGEADATEKSVGKLAPATIAKLRWGEPVNGLRMALAWPPALDDAALGAEPFFQLVVQNVGTQEVHFTAGDSAPNPRQMIWREDGRIVFLLSDSDAQKADWHLAPGQHGVLRMFTKEQRDENGKTVSSNLNNDLAGTTRYHAIATMEIAKAPEGSWTGKLTTGRTRGSADQAEEPSPKNRDARALYEVWKRHARTTGHIPGGIVGELMESIQTFIRYNPTWQTVPQLKAISAKFNPQEDLTPGSAIALLDEIAAVQDSPLSMALGKVQAIRRGRSLPEKFAAAAWGPAQPNGLRAAWLLDPVAAEHRLGAALQGRLLIHNQGRVPVALRVPTWHQGEVKARDAGGAEIQVSSVEWTTLAQLVPVQLAPGEFIEINTPGVGLGKDAGRGPWAGPRVGANILAKDGDALTLTHSAIPLDGSGVGVREDQPHLVGAGWWLGFLKTRLARELPLPSEGTERTALLDRVMRELFGVAPTAEDSTAFLADQSPEALDHLAQRLAARADVVEFSGKLDVAPSKFRVIAADPAADQSPRVVLGPGEYPICTHEVMNVTLKIVGRPNGDRTVNDAELRFSTKDGAPAPSPQKLALPDGWGTWGIVCRPDEGFFYVVQPGRVRKIDFSNPAKVTDAPANDLPAEFRDELQRQFAIHGISEAQQAAIFERQAPARESGSIIEGRMIDTAGRPLPQRRVMAKSAEQKAADAWASVETDANGRFRLENVPADREIFLFAPGAWKSFKEGATQMQRFEGGKIHRLRIVVENAGTDQETVKLESQKRLHSGDRAPALEALDASGDSANASSEWPWMGNLTIVHFWSLKDGAGHAQLDALRDIYAARQEKVRIVSLCVDGDFEAWLAHINRRESRLPNDERWIQVVQNPRASASADAYGVSVTPAVFVVGPDRTIRSVEIPPHEPKAAISSATDTPPQPKHEYAQSLLKSWQRYARTDGKIPGGLVGQLAEKVDQFTEQYPKDEATPKLAALRQKLDGSRDWAQSEVVAALDEITALSTAPVGWLNLPMEFDAGRNLRAGQPLPVELMSASWGNPAENGLRAAWLLEPRAEQYARGSALKARVLFHNTGKAPIVFQTETWHQDDGHTARDANGAQISVKATWFTGITPMATFRLAPGEYCEVTGHGIAIGAGEYKEEHSRGAVGAIIEAKEGDTVTLSHTVDAAQGGWTKPNDPKSPAELRKQVIAERVNREAPLPQSVADRKLLIRRVTLDLAGVPPTPEEVAAFTADAAPDALEKLIVRLQEKAGQVPWTGKLPTGETTFRVTAADPDAAKKPRVANAPSKQSEPVTVDVAKDGSLRMSDRALSLDELKAAAAREPGRAYTIHAHNDAPYAKVSELLEALAGVGAKDVRLVAVASTPKGGVLTPAELEERYYAARKKRGEPMPVGIGARAVLIRSLTLDITGELPTEEERNTFENDGAPDALGKVIARLVAKAGKVPPGLLDAEDAVTKPEKPKGAAAKLTPEALLGTWRGTVNGEKLMLSFHRPPAEKDVLLDIYFGEATIGALAGFTIAEDGSSAEVVQHSAGGGMKFGTLIPDEPGKLKLELYGRQKGQQELILTRAPQSAASEPQQKEARELFEMWKRTANDDGTIPGTFIGALATEVRAYVKANPNLNSGMALPKLLPRFVTTRDWTQAEAIKLLDDVAYYATEPIAARVAKAKLGSGPMWRTMVEFQDIPVQIAKWSEVKDGLRIGLRVVGGQWSAGGSVRVELWLHNASGKDVSFRTAGPNRQDVEVMFTAIDAEGHEHWPERNPTMLFALMMDCTLPAGHVAMAKEFDVTFADADNDLWSPLGHRFRDLKPGKYQLRSVLMLAKPEPAKSDEHIELTTPDFAFTLGGATAADETKPAPKSGAANERVKGQPRDWKVRVVDGSTGREQAGVTVVAWVFPREGGEGRRVEHVADGRDWAIKLADNEHATLACEDSEWVGGGASFHIGNLPPENPNAFGDREGARHTDPDKPFELRVWRGDTVKRRVLLPRGKPAAGVQVMLGARVDSQEWMRRLGVMNMSRFSFDHGEFSNWHSTAVTNQRGEFEAAFPPGEACTFTTVTCRTKETLTYEEKSDSAPQSDERITIQLEAGVRVFGRVVDTDGKPVARAQVHTTGQHPHENTYALTDGDGRYELRARPGVSQVSVDIRERNEKGEVTSHNATGIHAPENVVIPEGATEFARDFRIMRVTDAGPVLPPEGKPQRARDAAISFADYGKPTGEFDWVQGPWGAEKDGLSMALDLETNKADQWRAGGTVHGELYVRNNSTKAVAFPQHFAMHVGLAVTARDKDGKDHPARITMWDGCPALHHLTLPPGHAARVKIFTLQLDAPDSPERKTGASLELAPGKYKLRARWSDAHAMWAHDGEWTGTLESGEVDFSVAAPTAKLPVEAATDDARPAPKLAKLPEDSYAKVGVKVADMPVANLEWSEEQNGMCVGLLVPEQREWRIGSEVKVELWVCNPGEKDVKFAHIARRDIGLRVIMKGADGMEHEAAIAQFDAYPVFSRALLPAGFAFKAKEFSVVLLPPGGKHEGAEPHFTLPAGNYKFRCKVDLPGSTVTNAAGEQVTPAEGEWTGTLESGEVDFTLPAAK